MASESLRVTAGNAAGTEIPLEGDFQIGRSAEGHGRLGDDPELSRQHARIARDAGGQLGIEDLGSTNGTFVNGQRVSGRRPLSPGDEVRVGQTTLKVEGGAPAATQIGAPTPAAAPPPPAPPGPLPPTEQQPAAPFGGPPPGAQPPGPPPGAQPPGAPPSPQPPGGPQFGGPPAGPPPGAERGNGKAIVALVLGILAIVFSWVGIGLILAIIALVLGLRGRRAVDRGETRQHRGKAQAGFILGIVGIPLSIALTAIFGLGAYLALSESPDVQDTLLEFAEAVEQGEGDKACGLLTGSAEDEVEGTTGSCEAGVGTGGQLLSEEDKDNLRDHDVSVEFDGLDKASIDVDSVLGEGEWKFEKDDGWKISDFPD